MILTVIIPAYNVASTIERCLDSMIDNRISGLVEIIVVNDGSEDNTEYIVQKYCQKFSYIKLISKKNGGHGSTLNTGIVNACGKFIRIVDGDDYLDTFNFVQSVLALKNIEADIVCMPYQRVEMNSLESTYFNFPDFEPYFVHDINSIDSSKLYIALAATCFSRQLLRRACIRFLEHTSYVDVMLNIIPIIYLKTIVMLPFDVYRYVVGNSEQSISEDNMSKRYKEHEKVIIETLKICNINKDLISSKQILYINQVLGAIIYTHLNILFSKNIGKEELNNFINNVLNYGLISEHNIKNRVKLLKIKKFLNQISPRLCDLLQFLYKKIK